MLKTFCRVRKLVRYRFVRFSVRGGSHGRPWAWLPPSPGPAAGGAPGPGASQLWKRPSNERPGAGRAPRPSPGGKSAPSHCCLARAGLCSPRPTLGRGASAAAPKRRRPRGAQGERGAWPGGGSPCPAVASSLTAAHAPAPGAAFPPCWAAERRP